MSNKVPYTNTHSLYERDLKPHNWYCYIGIHNTGRIALGERIYITMFMVFRLQESLWFSYEGSFV
jgi:hypothetical protein